MSERAVAGRVSRLREWLVRRVAVDRRALAAFRIAFGTLFVVDLALRSRYLGAFYTDAGVLPRAALEARHPAFAAISIHALSGDAWLQVLLFLAAGVAGVAVLVGYRTRLALVVSWILLVSLHARNPIVLNGGDSVLRRLTFWALFLPLGSRWSIDAVRRRTSPSDADAASDDSGGVTDRIDGVLTDRVAGFATAALLVQVVVVYATNAVVKYRADIWPSGRAVRYVFSLEQFTVFVGDRLAAVPPLLTAIDWLWLGLLTVSPLLLLLTGRLRTLLAAAFAAGHLSMLATMQLGIFPLVAVAALLPFVHGEAWDRLDESGLPARVRRAYVTRVAGPLGTGVCDRLPSLSLPAVGPDQSTRRAARRWTHAGIRVLVAALLVALFAWNAAALGYVEVGDDAAVDPVQYRWDMFAPSPPLSDGWFVAPGVTTDGERVDAFGGGTVQWTPDDVSATYPTARWRKYLVSLWWSDDDLLQRALADHLCTRWNRTHAADLRNVSVYVVEQRTRFDGPEPTESTRLVDYDCDDGRVLE
jgi:hypothetical protein